MSNNDLEKINVSCSVYDVFQKFKIFSQVAGEWLFEKQTDDYPYTLWTKNLAETTLISKINALLHFMQKFKMATKNGRRIIKKKINR